MRFLVGTLGVLFAVTFPIHVQLMAQDGADEPVSEESELESDGMSPEEVAKDILTEDVQEVANESGMDLSEASILGPNDRILGINAAQYRALSNNFADFLERVGGEIEAAGSSQDFDRAMSQDAATLKIIAEQQREISNYIVQQMAVRRHLLVGVFFPLLSWGIEIAGRRLPRIGKVGGQGSIGLAFFWAQGEHGEIRWKYIPYFLAGPNFSFGKPKEKAGMAEDYQDFRDQNHIFTAGGALVKVPGVGLEINSIQDISGYVPYLGTAWDFRVKQDSVFSLGVYAKFGQKSSNWTSPEDNEFGDKAKRFASATLDNLESSVRPSAGLVYGFYAKGHQPKSVEWQQLEVLWLNTLGIGPQWADDGLFHDTQEYTPGQLLRRDTPLGELTPSEEQKIRSEVAGAKERARIREAEKAAGLEPRE